MRRLFLSILLILQLKHVAAQQISPYHLSSPKDYILSGSALAFGITGNILYNNKHPFTVNEIQSLDVKSINSFDRGAVKYYSQSASQLSDVMMLSSMATPAFLMIDKNMSRDAVPIGVMYFQTLACTAAEIQIVKGLIRRARPFNYNPDAPMSEKLKPDAGASFFSGHTAAAAAGSFFAAKVYCDYHPDSKLKPLLYSAAVVLPAFTGYLRYRAGKHFPTDIITGFIVGAVNGILIPQLHKIKNTK